MAKETEFQENLKVEGCIDPTSEVLWNTLCPFICLSICPEPLVEIFWLFCVNLGLYLTDKVTDQKARVTSNLRN